MSAETTTSKPRSPGKVIAAALGAAEGALYGLPAVTAGPIGLLPPVVFGAIGAVTGAGTAWGAEAVVEGFPKQTLVVNGSSTVEVQGPDNTTQTLSSSASASREDVPWIQKRSAMEALTEEVRQKLAQVTASQSEADSHIQMKDMAVAVRVESPTSINSL